MDFQTNNEARRGFTQDKEEQGSRKKDEKKMVVVFFFSIGRWRDFQRRGGSFKRSIRGGIIVGREKNFLESEVRM